MSLAAAALLLLCVGAAQRSSAAGAVLLTHTPTVPRNAVPLSQSLADGWGDSWSFNPFSPAYFNVLNDYTLLPLAIAHPPRYAGTYTPELAMSWQATPSTVTVHLRPHARWQDGRPVTSGDVVTTLLLQGTNGNSIWGDITAARTPDPHTVVLDLKKGAPPRGVLDDLLGVFPVPNVEYKRFVVPGLERDLLQYWGVSMKSGPTAATKTPANRVMTTTFKKVSSFAPKRLLGDGPFEEKSVTTEAAIATRWPNFWDARNVHVPEFEVINASSNTTSFGDLISHRVIFSQDGETSLEMDRWRRAHGDGWAVMPNFDSFALYFNARSYPLGLLGVRQAMAYVIDRSKLEALAGYKIYQSDPIPDGLTNPTNQIYLTATERKALNPYPTDPTKAAQILRSLRFHKKHGEWYTPKGTQFTVSLDGPAGWGDSMAQAEVMGRMLNAFGIKTTVSAINQPAYWTYQTEGRYQLDWGWGQGGLNPIAGFADVLVDEDFAGTGNPGLGFGPVGAVPSLGHVNIQTVLKVEQDSVGPGSKIKQLTWDWARFVNSQLPYLDFGDRIQQVAYSTTQYTDWPGRTSSEWAVAGIDLNGAMVIMMEKGQIRPTGRS